VQYEYFIGFRYTRARRQDLFVSLSSAISAVGIFLGVAALIVVLSVMNGFQKEIRERILGVVAHVQVTGADNSLAGWQAVAAKARADPRVLSAAPYVNGEAMLSFAGNVRGALVRGIDPKLENEVSDLGAHMIAGDLTRLQPGGFGVVLGAELARALRVVPGDRVTLIAPQGLVTPAGVVPRLKQFVVVGIFRVDHYEYDSGLALVDIADAQRLYQFGDRVSGIRLKLADLFQSRTVARDLYRAVGNDVLISDWTRSHANFFRAVEIEKRMMFIILTLIVTVAAFNVISTLVMVVTEKQADIAILRTLGATPRSVMKIFMVQGAVIGVLGTLLGVVGGVALALNIDVVVPFLEQLLGVQFLSRDVYYISELPSDLHLNDVMLIAAVSLCLSLAATLYPSWRAARVRPAEALRYE
jgi:lipoprotein-releasing system permease protein